MYLSLHKSDEGHHPSIPPTSIALPRKTITNPHQVAMSQYQNQMMSGNQRTVMNQGVQNSQLLYGNQPSNDYMMSQRYNQGLMKSVPYSPSQYDQKRLVQSMDVQKRPRPVTQNVPRQSYPIQTQMSQTPGVTSNDVMRSQQSLSSQGMARSANPSVMQQNANYSRQNQMYMQRQQVLQSPYSLSSSPAPSPRSTMSNQSSNPIGKSFSPLSSRQPASHTLPTMDTKRPNLSTNSLPTTSSQMSSSISRDPIQQIKSLAVG